MDVSTNYRTRFFVHVKEEVEKIENKVREKRGNISNVDVNEEVRDWVSNVGCSRTCDTKLSNKVDLYWHKQTFIS